MLNIYIYHQLSPTCFDICYTVFRETIDFLAQKLYVFYNVPYCCISFEHFVLGVMLKTFIYHQ